MTQRSICDPHYRERAAYVSSKAGRRLNRRRRAEILVIKARAEERRHTKSEISPIAEAATPNWFKRNIESRDSEKRKPWGPTIGKLVIVFVFFGPGLLLGKGVYGLSLVLSRWLGPPKWRFFLILAALVGALFAASFYWMPPVDGELWRIYWAVQATGGALRGAYLTWAWGWPGVGLHSADAELEALDFHGETLEIDEFDFDDSDEEVIQTQVQTDTEDEDSTELADIEPIDIAASLDGT